MEHKQLLETILQMARGMDASDVHISERGPVIFRVNGRLEEAGVQIEEPKELIFSMMNDQQKQCFDSLRDADFVYQDAQANRYRVNVYKEGMLFSAAIRVINNRIRSMDELQLPQVFKDLCELKNGLVLVTGPTGSGKSTTLAAMVDYINQTRNVHILTIEDPVEYVYTSKNSLIHQREIGQDVKNFNIAIRSALREDPDVILVGEMRDWETIQAVMTLAETGHLVFSTLHTTGAVRTIDRIIDSFPAEKQEQIRIQLSGVLRAVISQHLVPLQLGGRTAAYEIMVMTNAIRNLVREKKNHMIYSNIQMGTTTGMQTMESHLQRLVTSGAITAETAKEYMIEE